MGLSSPVVVTDLDKDNFCISWNQKPVGVGLKEKKRRKVETECHTPLSELCFKRERSPGGGTRRRRQGEGQVWRRDWARSLRWTVSWTRELDPGRNRAGFT